MSIPRGEVVKVLSISGNSYMFGDHFWIGTSGFDAGDEIGSAVTVSTGFAERFDKAFAAWRGVQKEAIDMFGKDNVSLPGSGDKKGRKVSASDLED